MPPGDGAVARLSRVHEGCSGRPAGSAAAGGGGRQGSGCIQLEVPFQWKLKQQLLEELHGNWIWSAHFTGLITTAITSACSGVVIPPHVQPALCDQLGLFQAAACGARLLVNQGPGLAEVFARPLERPVVDLETSRP